MLFHFHTLLPSRSYVTPFYLAYSKVTFPYSNDDACSHVFVGRRSLITISSTGNGFRSKVSGREEIEDTHRSGVEEYEP